MKTQSTFVGANSTVKLHSVTTINLCFSRIIHPWDLKRNSTLWLNKPFEYIMLNIFGVFKKCRFDGMEKNMYCLMELFLIRISLFYFFKYMVQITLDIMFCFLNSCFI